MRFSIIYTFQPHYRTGSTRPQTEMNTWIFLGSRLQGTSAKLKSPSPCVSGLCRRREDLDVSLSYVHTRSVTKTDLHFFGAVNIFVKQLVEKTGSMCERTVYKTWGPRRLTVLWASKVCYKDRSTLKSRLQGTSAKLKSPSPCVSGLCTRREDLDVWLSYGPPRSVTNIDLHYLAPWISLSNN
jgi:hypothetical protein